MASTGVDLGGNQIYVSIKTGTQWPPKTFDIRVKYEQTIKDIRQKAATVGGVPIEKLQMFWHKKELVPASYDHLTLAQMKMHTGFSIMAYNLEEEPDYFPPVEATPKGLVQKMPVTDAEYLAAHPEAAKDPKFLVMEKSKLDAAPGFKATAPVWQDSALLAK
ncbi:hypothetical protein CYMTET_31962 [Cymbomonas tetramitiformis]|uniref:Ubiquitin-like domain-containing protein n=1 Tax=Cymbomonas tetramitiformis TaxID=36881 RepID=A0AAE0FG88_9CHLO|nr:hypothetical protein CYMTET_31962 [Cymbomonas tetramitiformis]